MVFLDSSALVKLVSREPETPALRRYLASRPQRIACQLVRTEVPRAVRQFGPRALAKARSVLQRIQIVRLDDDLLAAAVLIDRAVVRSLEAIHLATAQLIARELEAVVHHGYGVPVSGRGGDHRSDALGYARGEAPLGFADVREEPVVEYDADYTVTRGSAPPIQPE